MSSIFSDKSNLIGASWFFEENLEVVLDYLATLANYQIDSGDWDAIDYGVKNKSSRDINFSYGFYTEQKIEFTIQKETGDSSYFIDVYGPKSLEKEVKTLLSIAQDYKLEKME